ncbi:hypothetical protein BC831DRAFT_491356 [Entophlyctis helioformis]|nr:hypothetical protein BC831DRAFT_491356 [Entophlyctis helioformis]
MRLTERRHPAKRPSTLPASHTLSLGLCLAHLALSAVPQASAAIAAGTGRSPAKAAAKALGHKLPATAMVASAEAVSGDWFSTPNYRLLFRSGQEPMGDTELEALSQRVGLDAVTIVSRAPDDSYVCVIPDVAAVSESPSAPSSPLEDSAGSASSGSTGSATGSLPQSASTDEVLTRKQQARTGQQLVRSMPCLYYVPGEYWTYEFCQGDHVRQFHRMEENEPRSNAPTEYFLGRYSKMLSAETVKVEDDTGSVWILKEVWGGGAICDLTNAPRETTVEYHCAVGNEEYVSSLREVASCKYSVTVHTPRLCRDRLFVRKELVTTSPIQCYPLKPGTGTRSRSPAADGAEPAKAAAPLKSGAKEKQWYMAPPKVETLIDSIKRREQAELQKKQQALLDQAHASQPQPDQQQQQQVAVGGGNPLAHLIANQLGGQQALFDILTGAGGAVTVGGMAPVAADGDAADGGVVDLHQVAAKIAAVIAQRIKMTGQEPDDDAADAAEASGGASQATDQSTKAGADPEADGKTRQALVQSVAGGLAKSLDVGEGDAVALAEKIVVLEGGDDTNEDKKNEATTEAHVVP